MKRLFLILAILPSLAFGQVLRRDSGTGTFSTAPTFPGAISTGTIQTKGLVSTALDTPVNATFVATTGTLNDGTYYYRVTALDAAGGTAPSTETSLTVSGGAASNGVIVNWGAVTGATSYKVYGRSTGAELYMATVTAPTVTWTDNGSVTPSGALPTLGTSGNISTVSGVTARDVTTSAASGAVALSGTNGAKFCPGANTACITSNGTSITIAGLTATTGNIDTLRSNTIYPSGTGAPFIVKGNRTTTGSAVAVRLSNNDALTTAGDKIVDIAPLYSGSAVAKIDILGTYEMDGTDASGTPGAATINQPIGQVSVAATASSVVVTNSLVTSTSVVIPVLQFVDATCTQILSCVPGAGSFTVTMNAACTANTKVGFIVHNYF